MIIKVRIILIKKHQVRIKINKMKMINNIIMGQRILQNIKMLIIKENLKVEDEAQGSALGSIGLKPKIVH